MADEFSNVNGGSSTNDSIPVSMQQADVSSRSEGAIGTETYRQQVEESHHDLVNLLTQQMTAILNPMMADHESTFERLARQVERIARIVEYDEGERHNARGNNERVENIFQNENNIPNRKNPHVVPRGSTDQTYEKEKEKYRNEQRSKSKPFTRKEKVAYVTMESSEEEVDFETEVDLAKLKKGPPYVCPLLKKLPMNMVGMSYDFDVALEDFESQVRSVYPRTGDGLLDFLVQQKIKDWNVSLCPRCNTVFDAEVAAIFEK
ncbi:hypothetical protein Ahy_B02g060175 [Arachis hypogaea]|uniref:Uncharacterized protein n=1 Tax=Arachis hypogaea TaxID=3818 RepID=A0A445AI26_ARAHY|nr:hypothetical protein Ahy_B02g060175 [Arachis hypogaea]